MSRKPTPIIPFSSYFLTCKSRHFFLSTIFDNYFVWQRVFSKRAKNGCLLPNNDYQIEYVCNPNKSFLASALDLIIGISLLIKCFVFFLGNQLDTKTNLSKLGLDMNLVSDSRAVSPLPTEEVIDQGGSELMFCFPFNCRSFCWVLFMY